MSEHVVPAVPEPTTEKSCHCGADPWHAEGTVLPNLGPPSSLEPKVPKPQGRQLLLPSKAFYWVEGLLMSDNLPDRRELVDQCLNYLGDLEPQPTREQTASKENSQPVGIGGWLLIVNALRQFCEETGLDYKRHADSMPTEVREWVVEVINLAAEGSKAQGQQAIDLALKGVEILSKVETPGAVVLLDQLYKTFQLFAELNRSVRQTEEKILPHAEPVRSFLQNVWEALRHQGTSSIRPLVGWPGLIDVLQRWSLGKKIDLEAYSKCLPPLRVVTLQEERQMFGCLAGLAHEIFGESMLGEFRVQSGASPVDFNTHTLDLTVAKIPNEPAKFAYYLKETDASRTAKLTPKVKGCSQVQRAIANYCVMRFYSASPKSQPGSDEWQKSVVAVSGRVKSIASMLRKLLLHMMKDEQGEGAGKAAFPLPLDEFGITLVVREGDCGRVMRGLLSHEFTAESLEKWGVKIPEGCRSAVIRDLGGGRVHYFPSPWNKELRRFVQFYDPESNEKVSEPFELRVRGEDLEPIDLAPESHFSLRNLGSLMGAPNPSVARLTYRLYSASSESSGRWSYEILTVGTLDRNGNDNARTTKKLSQSDLTQLPQQIPIAGGLHPLHHFPYGLKKVQQLEAWIRKQRGDQGEPSEGGDLRQLVAQMTDVVLRSSRNDSRGRGFG